MRFRFNPIVVLTLSATVLLGGCLSQAETGPNHGLWQLQKQRSQRFLSATKALAQTTQSVCSQGTDVDKARQAWKKVMTAWMPLQGVEKGSEQAWHKVGGFSFILTKRIPRDGK